MSEKIIVKMRFGSHVYGTNTPDSDEDFKEVFVPEAEDILLQRATKVSRNRSTGNNDSRNGPGDVDVEEFSLHGYMKLLCEGQTVAIDMLFVPEEHVIEKSLEWDFIRAMRREFVSKSIAPFVGYCRAQANKYGIKGSRMAAAKRVNAYLATLHPDMRLEASAIEHVLGSDIEHIEFVDIEQPGGNFLRHIDVCGRKCSLNQRAKVAIGMYAALWDKYGERSRQAMDNEGVDWKAVMHAHRICEQAIELLETGEVVFPRPNAAELLKIRLGQRPFKEVSRELEEKLELLELAVENSILQAAPNRKLAESIVESAYREAVIKGWK